MEIFGLMWEDVDFERNMIHIRHNLTRSSAGLINGQLKTKSSRRDIYMPDGLPDLLRRTYAHQAEQRDFLKTLYQDNNLVVCRADGSPFEPNKIVMRFKVFCEKNGIKPVRLHDLRHSHATLMLSAGISPKAIQQRLGHSNFSTTMDIYAHVLEDVQIDAARKLDAVLALPSA